MPELPEVETVKNVLNSIIKNREIISIDVLRKSTIKGDEKEFVNSLRGETFLEVSRKGKFLIFHLSHDKVIISHLRMEGKFYEVDEKEDNTHYSRVVFHLDNDKKLCYDDSRCFGMMILSAEKDYLEVKDLAKLGPEPFEIKDVNYLLKATKNKKLPIKSVLLDQSLLTGLGNIYVDETLYASKIHPWTPANLITKNEWEEIIKNACLILNKAISMGGSTIKSYHPGKGIDGSFQTAIKIYGKEGETCPLCGKTFRFVKTNGRGTTFCPSCQIKKGRPIHIAITGEIASGKSLAREIFAKEGIPTLSADEIVKDLYQKEEISKKIEKILKISFPTKVVDKNILRNHLAIHPDDVKKINRYIHPLVKKEMANFLKENNEISLIEVPLLFESKTDNMFDTIIVILTDEEAKKKRLEKRDNKTKDIMLEINKNSKAFENKNKATYLVYNNKEKSDFIKEIQSIINKEKSLLN